MKKQSVFVWLTLSSVAFAPALALASATDDAAPSSHNAVKVVKFTTGHSGYSETQFADSEGTLKFCSGTPSPIFRISRSHPSHEQLTKGLTAAFLAGKKVNVSYENVSGTCYLKRITMDDFS